MRIKPWQQIVLGWVAFNLGHSLIVALPACPAVWSGLSKQWHPRVGLPPRGPGGHDKGKAP